MNYIFLSPNFPDNYWKFCRELSNNGAKVLGIGDCPYDELKSELRSSLTEYYKVSSLENYDEVYRAVAFFAFKYGKIDRLESNNEYWLERDARLRDDFNVEGIRSADIPKLKYKSKMKACYEKAGIKCARYCLVKSLSACRKFIDEVGYPVVVKPDNGVGANATYKLKNDEELKEFFAKNHEGYIMEEFISAEVNSYDAIIDCDGNPVFETGNVTCSSLMDVVNDGGDCAFYIVKDLADDIRDAGRWAVKAFGVKERFVHFEFFRLLKDQHIGAKGEVVALEVNMRPAGGMAPDMMNYANGVDVFKIWADVMTCGKTSIVSCDKNYCAFAGRRFGREYSLSEQDILDIYGKKIKAIGRVPDALAPCMGNLMYIAVFKDKKEVKAYYSDLFRRGL